MMCNSQTLTRFASRLFATASLMLLSACAGPSLVPLSSADSASGLAGLDRWVQRDLATALIDQLTEQPRFEGETIAIVKLDNGDLTPAIDSLTERVRRDLEDRLIRAGGISLIWQRPGSASGNCNTLDDAGFFVGIDSAPTDTDITLRVRMLDRRDNSWVPQLSYQYRGRADATIRDLTSRVVADSNLQGTRIAPFGTEETDLAAQRLAKQLGCVVQRTRRSAVLALAENEGQSDQQQILHSLIGNYLQQQPGVVVAADGQSADYRIRVQHLQVDSTRSQIWLRPQLLDAEVPLESVSAYLLNTTASQPSVAAGQPLQPVASNDPLPTRVAGSQQAIDLVRDFRAYTPADRALCEARNPWTGDNLALADSAALASGACFALKVSLQQSAFVYLLHEGPDGALTRLIPDNCALQAAQSSLSKADFWFPSLASGHILDLDEQTGIERFHLLAMDSAQQASDTRQALAGLPALSSACSHPKGIELRDIGTNGLLATIKQDNAAVQWQSRSLQHEP